MGDHTESIQLEFDPELIGYEELLDIFWNSHNPTHRSVFGGRQYMSLVMCHDEGQREKASAVRQKWEKEQGASIKTEIIEEAPFYPAEDYHQKYFLRRYKKAVQTLAELYPDEASFRDAAITARLNGFVRGRSSMEKLKQEIRTWGWNTEEIHRVIQVLDAIRW